MQFACIVIHLVRLLFYKKQFLNFEEFASQVVALVALTVVASSWFTQGRSRSMPFLWKRKLGNPKIPTYNYIIYNCMWLCIYIYISSCSWFFLVSQFLSVPFRPYAVPKQVGLIAHSWHHVSPWLTSTHHDPLSFHEKQNSKGKRRTETKPRKAKHKWRALCGFFTLCVLLLLAIER